MPPPVAVIVIVWIPKTALEAAVNAKPLLIVGLPEDRAFTLTPEGNPVTEKDTG